MPVSQNVSRFITSFMQGIEGCGQVRSVNHRQADRIFHVTHLDGCELDVPEEVTEAMTEDQLREAFGVLTSSVSSATPPPPPIATTPMEVTVDTGLAERAEQDLNRLRRQIENSDYGGGLSAPRASLPSPSSVATTRVSRGRKFRKLLEYAGVTLPERLDASVGAVLQEMYGAWEDKLRRYQTQWDRVNTNYNESVAAWQRIVDQSKNDTLAAVRDAEKLARLRSAAIDWRECTGGANEKFEKFTALMNSIDAVEAAAPVSSVEEVMPGALPSLDAEPVNA